METSGFPLQPPAPREPLIIEDCGLFEKIGRSFYDFTVYRTIAEGSWFHAVATFLLVILALVGWLSFDISNTLSTMTSSLIGKLELRSFRFVSGTLLVDEPLPWIIYEDGKILVAFDPDETLREKKRTYQMYVLFYQTFMESGNLDKASHKEFFPANIPDFKFSKDELTTAILEFPWFTVIFLGLLIPIFFTLLIGLLLTSLLMTAKTSGMVPPLNFGPLLKIGVFALIAPCILTAILLQITFFAFPLGFFTYMLWCFTVLSNYPQDHQPTFPQTRV